MSKKNIPVEAVEPSERPPMPERFTNGGASAEERAAWIAEHWGDLNALPAE